MVGLLVTHLTRSSLLSGLVGPFLLSGALDRHAPPGGPKLWSDLPMTYSILLETSQAQCRDLKLTPVNIIDFNAFNWYMHVDSGFS